MQNLDRRLIYLVVLLALVLPLLLGFSVRPARMQGADKAYSLLDRMAFDPGDVALVALDFGPGTRAENEAQAEVLLEHLLRRRLPFVLFAQYPEAELFLNLLPERVAAKLRKENPGQNWNYGKDWINLGYIPGAFLFIQEIPKAKNLAEYFKKEVRGSRVADLPGFSKIRDFKNIKFLAEISGSYGAIDPFVQFLRTPDHQPIFVHGCTSITIPEAYIFLDSGQLKGLFEGIAGAAWYSELLSEHFPGRIKDRSVVTNTGLGVAHLVIILLVLAGNLSLYWGRGKKA